MVFEGVMVEYHRKSEGEKTYPLFCLKLWDFVGGIYIRGFGAVWYMHCGFCDRVRFGCCEVSDLRG